MSNPKKSAAPLPFDEPTTTALVTTTPSAVPAVLYDDSDLGAGFEDFTKDDVAVPFIAILQKQSPQAEEDNPKYIKGAKPGMLFNTVSSAIYDGKERGITVIPVHRVRSYIEWIPKDDGGGLVNVFTPDSEAVKQVLADSGKQFGKLKIGDGNDLVETFSMFALVVREDGTYERVVISFSSSQIATYKRWMTMAQSVQVPTPDGRLVVPPMFAHKYRLKTAFTQKKDYTWYKYAVQWDGDDALASRLTPSDPLYHAAKEFRQMVISGSVKADYEAGAKDLHADEGSGNDFDM